MINRKLMRAFWAWIAALAIFGTSPVFAQDDASEEMTELSAESSQAVEEAVASEGQSQTADTREQIIREAESALQETYNALTALEEERIDDALSSLVLATGQLELILARDPELSLAPTGVSTTSKTVLGSRASIERAIDDAEDFLRDGKVQDARRILDGLASELVITVTNIPLGTYPDAIKAIAPLIDDGEYEAARHGLQAALNTLVLTDHVIPIPVLRSEALLEQAELLAEKEDRSAEESEELASLLSASREALELAELLGYGERGDYVDLYAQIEDIEEKTADGQSGTGFFSGIKNSMSELWASIAS